MTPQEKREKHRQRQAKYREENREAYNAYHREYYARCKEDGVRNTKDEATTRWREKNAERVKAYRHQYYLEHREKYLNYFKERTRKLKEAKVGSEAVGQQY